MIHNYLNIIFSYTEKITSFLAIQYALRHKPCLYYARYMGPCSILITLVLIWYAMSGSTASRILTCIGYGISLGALWCMMYYGNNYIKKDSSIFQKTYYKTLPYYLYVIGIILIIMIALRLENIENIWLRSMIIIWGFVFFDSRYFAVMALYMLLRVIVSTLIGDQIGVELYAIHLYYYMVITVIIGLIEPKLSFFDHNIHHKN